MVARCEADHLLNVDPNNAMEATGPVKSAHRTTEKMRSPPATCSLASHRANRHLDSLDLSTKNAMDKPSHRRCKAYLITCPTMLSAGRSR